LRLALQQELDQVIASLRAQREAAAHVEAMAGRRSVLGNILLSIPCVSTWTRQQVKRVFPNRSGLKSILWSARVSSDFEQLDQGGQFCSPLQACGVWTGLAGGSLPAQLIRRWLQVLITRLSRRTAVVLARSWHYIFRCSS